jgi:threonine/homoserine/homoserine lactone efflux protein
MGRVIAEVVPLGVGIAASPFPIVPAILLLFTARPRPAALAFLTGWALGILAVTAAAVLLASVIELQEETPTWAAWTKLILGLVLVILAYRQWAGRAAAKEPAWMRALDDATPASALRLGVLLSVPNPKVALLAAASGLTIGAAELSTAGAAIALVTFVVVASSTVALPLLSYVVLGDRALAPLSAARDWFRVNQAVVVALVLAVIGVLLVVEGLAAL